MWPPGPYRRATHQRLHGIPGAPHRSRPTPRRRTRSSKSNRPQRTGRNVLESLAKFPHSRGRECVPRRYSAQGCCGATNRLCPDDHADGVEVPLLMALCLDTRIHRRGKRLRTYSARAHIFEGCLKQHTTLSRC